MIVTWKDDTTVDMVGVPRRTAVLIARIIGDLPDTATPPELSDLYNALIAALYPMDATITVPTEEAPHERAK